MGALFNKKQKQIITFIFIIFIPYFFSVLYCLFPTLLPLFFFFQCRWRVCRHPHDQGPSVSHRACPLGAPSHLQVLLLHWRHLLPFWPADLQDEVRFLDVRPRQDWPGALWECSGPEGRWKRMDVRSPPSFLSPFLILCHNCSLVICQLMSANASVPPIYGSHALFPNHFVLQTDAS